MRVMKIAGAYAQELLFQALLTARICGLSHLTWYFVMYSVLYLRVEEAQGGESLSYRLQAIKGSAVQQRKTVGRL